MAVSLLKNANWWSVLDASGKQVGVINIYQEKLTNEEWRDRHMAYRNPADPYTGERLVMPEGKDFLMISEAIDYIVDGLSDNLENEMRNCSGCGAELRPQEYCLNCTKLAQIKKFDEMPSKPWDMREPVKEFIGGDHVFNGYKELVEYCSLLKDFDIKEVRLVYLSNLIKVELPDSLALDVEKARK